MTKALLITGATGKQGRALINALVESPQSSSFTILATTRSASSPSAKSLVALSPSTIKLVEGDMNDVPALFRTAQAQLPPNTTLHGVFSLQAPHTGGGGADAEEVQGKAIVDEAIAHSVKHFVYTSVDRGGDKSPSSPTDIPHFVSKHNIEGHLKTKAGPANMTWTILRPTAFMDNLTPDFMGKIFTTSWSKIGEKKLQLISCRDIGYVAAQAFLKEGEWRNREFSLAGDELNFEQANEVFKKTVGRGQGQPMTFGLVASGVLWAVKDMGLMFKWFGTVGYGADVDELRRIHPKMLNWGQWLEQQSAFKR